METTQFNFRAKNGLQSVRNCSGRKGIQQTGAFKKMMGMKKLIIADF